MQLDKNSVLLRGITYTQLLGLAKYHKKTPYLLVSPFMEQVSTFVVTAMTQQPNLLLETCRFLSLSPSDFLLPSVLVTLTNISHLPRLMYIRCGSDLSLGYSVYRVFPLFRKCSPFCFHSGTWINLVLTDTRNCSWASEGGRAMLRVVESHG